MSLFFTPTGAEARGKKGSKKVIKISPAEQKHLNCSTCPLDREPLNNPKMPPTGAEHPAVYVLGEAPGKTEDEEGVQFVGASGKLIRDLIPPEWEHRVRWNNTLRCRPPKNREPAALELASCRGQQEKDIEQSRPQVIIGFGGVPLHWMLGSDRQISIWRGRRIPVQVGSHVCWYYPITHPAALLHGDKDGRKNEANKVAFERDVYRVFWDLEGLPEPLMEEDYRGGLLCLDEYGTAGLKRIEDELAMIREEDHAIDLETTGLRPYNKDARILTFAAGTYDKVFAFGWHHREARWSDRERKAIRDIVYGFLQEGGRRWAHQAKFEQEWLRHEYGPDILYKLRWDDTMAQAHVLDERRDKGLDDLTQLHLGFRLKSLSNVDVKNLANEPLSEVLPYNGMDVKYCYALSIIQAELLEGQGLTPVYEMLNAATPALVQMQAKGVVRDLAAIKLLDTDLTRQEEAIKARILGNRDVKSFQSTGAKFNPASNPDLVSFFKNFLSIKHPSRKRRRDEEDSYSVNEETLSQFKHPVAAMILELREMKKNHGYVTPLFDGGKYVHDDGLVHSSYSNLVTVTGRLASEDPNQQNYPRRRHKEIRRVVGCPPGHLFVAFDYGQLEARVVAAISDDPVLKAEIFAEQDIHGDWTDQIGGRFIPKRVKEERKKVRDSIKQYWTFANFYGNVLEAVAYDLSREFGIDISADALAPFFDSFWERYKGVLAWQERLLATYWEVGYVATATGQRRHEPMNRNELINQPIQGTAGHLVIDAQIRLSKIAYEMDVPALQPIMNIHDDLSFYLPIKQADDYIEIIAEHMVCCPFEFITVPLMVEVSAGENWCDKEEIVKFTTKDFK